MTPKIQQIIQEIMTRLETIDGQVPMNTAIGNNVSNAPALNFDELPACTVIRDPREVDDQVGKRAALLSTVTVQGAVGFSVGQSAQAIGENILADIAVALETKDANLGGLIRDQLEFVRDSIAIPENVSNTVVASVTYSIPHVRRYGDPYN